MIDIEMLPARYGDSIWIRYGASQDQLHHVLVDTGFEPTANEIRKRLRDDEDIAIDLLVMTHIDADHIEGSIFLLQDEDAILPERVHDVWFNGWEQIDSVADDAMGALQGEYLSGLIRKRKLPWNDAFGGKAVVVDDQGPLPVDTLPGGMKLTLLSPSRAKLKALRSYWVKDLKGKLAPGDEKAAMERLEEDAKYAIDALGQDNDKGVDWLVNKTFREDRAKANGSSIAFLAEYEGKRLLLTGDAHPSVLVDSLQRLQSPGSPLALEVLKVSHHGSRGNTSPELLDALRCKHALLSTNGVKFEHPDAECIARLVHHHRHKDFTLHFNYATEFNARWKDSQSEYGYGLEYGDSGSLRLVL